jgi:hypothetical protein
VRILVFFFTLELLVDRSSIIYYIYMLKNNLSRFLVASSVAISVITIGSQPSFAGSRNEDFANITNSELESYCNGKITATYGEVRLVTRSERLFSCAAEVPETYGSRAELEGEMGVDGKIGGMLKGIGASGSFTKMIKGSADGSVTLIVRSQRRQFELKNYCRDLYSYKLGHIYNPINGNGRIFVANGGRTCQRTVVD